MAIATKTRLRAQYRAAGCCTYCPALALPGRRLCEHHTAYNRERRRLWRQARTQERGGMR